MTRTEFTAMIGRTMHGVAVSKSGESLQFGATDGSLFEFFHDGECCESVRIEDIAGDLSDLVGAPLLMAECEVSKPNASPEPEKHEDSWTWSFYKFRTHKGDVTVRWLGMSNGCYSETVAYKETIKS